MRERLIARIIRCFHPQRLVEIWKIMICNCQHWHNRFQATLERYNVMQALTYPTESGLLALCQRDAEDPQEW